MTPSLPSQESRRALALKATWATLWILAVSILPAYVPLRWSALSGPFWPALLGATLILAWPPLRAATFPTSQADPSRPLNFLARAIFALAALVPALLQIAATLPNAKGYVASLLLIPLAATLPTRRPTYALLLFLAATQLATQFATSKHAEPGSSIPTSAQDEPGSFVSTSVQDEPGSIVSGSIVSRVVGKVWPGSVLLEGGVVRDFGLEGFAPLLALGGLLEGERREVRAWVVGPEELGDWGVFDMDGAVAPLEAAEEFSMPRWAVRGGPSLHARRDSSSFAAALVVLLGLVGVVAVQRSSSMSVAARIGAHLVIGVSASVGGIWLGGGVVGADLGDVVAVIEGRRLEDGGTEWVRVERSFGGFEWRGDALLGAFEGEISVGGERGVARTERDIRVGQEAARIVAVEADAPVDWRRPFEAGLKVLVPEVNTWGSFAASWERTGGGEWRSMGPWAVGEAVPEVSSPSAEGGDLGSGGPGESMPGWCATGLPQGASIFVGRLEADPGAGEVTWVRLVGFRP